MAWLASVGRRLRRSPPWVGDGVLALLLVVPAATTVGDNEPDPLALFIAFVLLQTLSLAVRRYWPRAVFAVSLGAALGNTLLTDSPALPVGVVVALYTVAAHCDRRTALRAALATVLLVPALFLSPGGGDGAPLVLPATLLLVIGWVLGDNLRTRRAYLRELEEKAERLEREREENARRAAAEEQARIARELHDVIAHNVSVMVVQAAAAGDVFDSQPAKAREALASIEHTGREALTELRRLLGAVRTQDGKRPQPGLGRLPALLDQVRSAGLRVDFTTEGEERQLPLGIDLSAYRIVQEALTNTLKHAAARRAEVVLRYSDDELSVDVVDDGRGATSNGDAGHGLIGMRERVALYNGDLIAGPRPEGGFAVSARFPLE